MLNKTTAAKLIKIPRKTTKQTNIKRGRYHQTVNANLFTFLLLKKIRQVPVSTRRGCVCVMCGGSLNLNCKNVQPA